MIANASIASLRFIHLASERFIHIVGIRIEAGVGVGLTAGTDKLTFKLMLSRDLNSRPKSIFHRAN